MTPRERECESRREFLKEARVPPMRPARIRSQVAAPARYPPCGRSSTILGVYPYSNRCSRFWISFIPPCLPLCPCPSFRFFPLSRLQTAAISGRENSTCRSLKVRPSIRILILDENLQDKENSSLFRRLMKVCSKVHGVNKRRKFNRRYEGGKVNFSYQRVQQLRLCLSFNAL